MGKPVLILALVLVSLGIVILVAMLSAGPGRADLALPDVSRRASAAEGPEALAPDDEPSEGRSAVHATDETPPRRAGRGKPAPARRGSVVVYLLGRAPDADEVFIYLEATGGRREMRTPGAGKREVRFEELVPGEYLVSCQTFEPPNYPPRSLRLEPGAELRVELAPGDVTLRGVVRSRNTVLDGGWIWCRVGAGDPGLAAGVFEHDGTFTITGLAAGPATLIFEQPGIQFEKDIELREVDSWEEFDLPGGRVTGVLHNVRGSREHSVRVAPDSWRDAVAGESRSTPVSEEGEFVLENLEAGRYLAYPSDGCALPARFLIGPGRQDARVELTAAEPGLQRGLTCYVDVPTNLVGEEGLRSLSCFVVPRFEDGYFFGAARYPSSRKGSRFHFGGLLDVPYGVVVRMRVSGATLVHWVPDVAVGRPMELDVKLGTGGRVRFARASEAADRHFLWRLQMPDGAWLPSDHLVGGHGDLHRAVDRELMLPMGSYAVEADVGTSVSSRSFVLKHFQDALKMSF